MFCNFFTVYFILFFDKTRLGSHSILPSSGSNVEAVGSYATLLCELGGSNGGDRDSI